MSSIFGRPQPMPSSAYGGGGFQQQQQQQSERMEATLMELDMVSDIFNRLVKSCHAKCVSKPYTDATLTKGESVCAERCVLKYMAANEKVGERMQAQGQALQAQQQQQVAGGGGEKKGWFS